MLQTVRVTNINKAQMTLSFSQVIGGLLISDLTGVDPVDAEIIFSEYAGQDGSEYQSSIRGNRNIVFTLDVDPYTAAGNAQEIRHRLMKFFMPKSLVSFEFERSGAPNVIIDGRVESFDFPLNVAEPQVTLSIISTKPDFVDPVLKTVKSMTNEGTGDTVIQYEGTVETGFVFRMRVDRNDISEFTIFHRPGDGSLRKLEFDGDLVAGDIIEISTVSREKRATLTRYGEERSILYAISPYSEWLNLFPGYNNIVVYLKGPRLEYTIEYTDKIGGL